MRINRSVIALAAAFSLSVFGFSGQAGAATCNPDGTGSYPYGDPLGTGGTVSSDFVSGSTSCKVGIIGGAVDANDSVGDIETLFGISNVSAAGKFNWSDTNSKFEFELGSASTDIGFDANGVGGAQTGKWSVVSDFWTLFSSLIIVQADGGPNPGKWVAFEIAEDVFSGEWWSIFTNRNGGVQDVSHITAYVVESGNNNNFDVPLPAALPLLGGGMAILGIIGIRKRRSTMA